MYRRLFYHLLLFAYVFILFHFINSLFKRKIVWKHSHRNKNSLNKRSFREITVSSPQSKAQTKNKLKHEQEIENSLEKPEKSSVNNML